MSGKATKAQRQAYESRVKHKGAGMLTVRLSPDANRMLYAICAAKEFTPRQVIEGLLLGTTALADAVFAAEYGASPHESAVYRSMK